MKKMLSIIIATAIFIQVFLPIQGVKAESFEAPKYWETYKREHFLTKPKVAIENEKDQIIILDVYRGRATNFAKILDENWNEILNKNIGFRHFTDIKAVKISNVEYLYAFVSGIIYKYDSDMNYINYFTINGNRGFEIYANNIFSTYCPYSTCFLGKYDLNGNLLGSKTIPGYADDIEIDPNGYFYLSIGSKIYKYSNDWNNFSLISSWGSSGTGDGQFGSYIDGLIVIGSRLYATDYENGRIQVFDLNGNFINSISSSSNTSGVSLIHPAGLTETRDGNLLVADPGNKSVQKITPDGQLLKKVGGDLYPTRYFLKPGKITYANENLYVVDSSHSIINIFKDKYNFSSLGSIVTEEGQIYNPRDLKFDKYGNFYAADYKNSKPIITKYDKNWNYLGIVVSDNNSDSEFSSIAIGSNDVIYVVRKYLNRIEMYSLDGNFIGSFGSKGSGNGEFLFYNIQQCHSCSIALDQDNNVFVPDTFNYRIQKFDKDGNFLLSFGSYGETENQFVEPEAVFIKGDKAYIVDFGAGKIKVFDLYGNFIGQFGQQASSYEHTGFNYPVSLFVDEDFVYISDKNNRRVELYKFDKAPDLFDTLIPSEVKENNLKISGVAKDDFGTVAKVEYMLNGGTVGGIGKLVGRVNAAGLGEWTICNANDGVFDQKVEEFNCEVGNLKNGNYTIYIRATDDSGHVTEVARYVIGSFNVTGTSNLSDNVSNLLAKTGSNLIILGYIGIAVFYNLTRSFSKKRED